MTLKIPFVTVEPVVYFCIASSSLLMVSIPQLILNNVCRRNNNNATECSAMETGALKDPHKLAKYQEVQQHSAMWLSAYVGTATFIVLFTLPTVGVISDVVGRRKTLFLTPVSQLIQSVLLICIIASGMQFSTWLLLLQAMVPAIVGEIGGLYLFASAYICAITSAEQRTLRLTLIDAASLLAYFTATLSSGFLIEHFGYIGIYVTVIVLDVLAILHLVFFVKPDDEINETIAQQNNNGNEERISEENLHSHEKESKEKIPVASSQIKDGSNDAKPSGQEPLLDCNTNVTSITSRKLLTGKEASTGFDDKIPKSPKDENPKTELVNSSAVIREQEAKRDFKKFEFSNAASAQIDVKERHVDPDESGMIQSSPSGFLESPSSPCGFTEPLLGYNEDSTAVYVQGKEQTDGQGMGDSQINNTLAPCLEQSTGKKISLSSLSRHLNPIKNFKIMYRILKAMRHVKIGMAIMLVMALATLSYMGEVSIVILYLKSQPFYFTAREIGYMLAYESAITSILGLLLLNWILQKCFKLSDITMLLVSTAACVPYQILMGLANSTAMLYSVQILHAVCTLSTPTMRSMLSKMVKKSSVGTMLGAVVMVETLAVMIGGSVVPLAHAGLLVYYPGAAFFLLAGIMLLATGIVSICAFVFPKDINEKETEQEL